MLKPSCCPVSAKLTAEFIQSALQDCSLCFQLLSSSVTAVLTLEENEDCVNSKTEQHAKAKKEIAYRNRTQYMRHGLAVSVCSRTMRHGDLTSGTDLNPCCDCARSILLSLNLFLSSLIYLYKFEEQKGKKKYLFLTATNYKTSINERWKRSRSTDYKNRLLLFQGIHLFSNKPVEHSSKEILSDDLHMKIPQLSYSKFLLCYY